MRFQHAQSNKTLNHPSLPQPDSDDVVPFHANTQKSVGLDGGGDSSVPSGAESDNQLTAQDNTTDEDSFCFVVSADTQFGMTRNNLDWSEEIKYSKAAVAHINDMEQRPLFCCVCGDLVHMTSEIYATKDSQWTRKECDDIQDAQIKDFKSVWSELHPDIALVCVCGNHDVGNRPTPTSIERFRARFGDDWLAFWARNCYNIVVNSSLFNDNAGAEEYYTEQLQWLENRLQYASEKNAQHILIFGHHPWFLYHEDEEAIDMKGYSPLPPDLGKGGKVDDSYFHIPKKQRSIGKLLCLLVPVNDPPHVGKPSYISCLFCKALALFKKYKVTAAFSGHFHQNLVSRSSFGMEMIVTSSLSCVMESTGIPETFDEPKTRGIRIVNIGAEGTGSFSHQFTSL